MRAAFGDCLYDAGARRLTRAGRPCHLSPRAFELLGALLEAWPNALSKADLRKRLWPDTHVAGTSLAQLVTELRKAIGDDPKRPRFVRTVFGFGYVFEGAPAPVPGPEGPAAEGPGWLLWGARVLPLRAEQTLLGRGKEADVQIPAGNVSRRHARIVTAPQPWLEDLQSRNGTFLNGHRIRGPVPLKDGDLIGIGPATLLYCAPDPESATRSGAGPLD